MTLGSGSWSPEIVGGTVAGAGSAQALSRVRIHSDKVSSARFAAAFQERSSRDLTRMFTLVARGEATEIVYLDVLRLSIQVRTCYRSRMSRWIGSDVATMPLGQIEEEIARLSKRPMSDRTVVDTERLADLREAQRRITGQRGYRGCGR